MHGVSPASSELTPEDVMIMQHLFSAPGVATAALNYYRHMFFLSPADFALYTQSKLTKPCLVVWGSDDAALRPDLNAGLGEVSPGAEVVVIAGGSHFIQQDRSAAVNGIIEAFLRKSTGNSQSK
jgi:pimeloyl-ACP methyl ester carboxylesterase